jgi:hypothetical protein
MENESETKSIRVLIKQYQILQNVRWQHDSPETFPSKCQRKVMHDFGCNTIHVYTTTEVTSLIVKSMLFKMC